MAEWRGTIDGTKEGDILAELELADGKVQGVGAITEISGVTYSFNIDGSYDGNKVIASLSDFVIASQSDFKPTIEDIPQHGDLEGTLREDACEVKGRWSTNVGTHGNIKLLKESAKSDHREGHPSYTDKLADVIIAELDYISERRKVMNLSSEATRRAYLISALTTKPDQKQPGEAGEDSHAGPRGKSPTAWLRAISDAGLVGLALSGGGIRSATFSLGLLQALAKADVLKHVDYLSTVSGGGYIGSCLTSLLHPNPPREKHGFIRKFFEGEGSSRRQQMREEGTDKPTASVESAKFPFRFQDDQMGNERSELKHLRKQGRYLIPSGRLLTGQDFWRLIGMYLTGVVTNNFVPLAIILILAFSVKMLETVLSDARTLTYGYLCATVFFLAAVVIRALATIYSLSFRMRKFRGRIIATLVSLSAVTAAVTGLIHMITIDGDLLDGISAFEGVKTFDKFKALLIGVSGVLAIGLVTVLVRTRSKRWGSILEKVFRVAWVALIPIALFQGLVWLSNQGWITETTRGGVPIVPVVAGLLALASFYINPNRTSMHNFYRDRLSEAYIIRHGDKGEPDSNEGLDLSELYEKDGKSGAPYHLINTTLNVPSTENLQLRGRGSDLFIYSGFYCGSEATGYRRTDHYERGDTSLATAMAISGAAASPQMGTSPRPAMAFLMTLLNLRLNRWVPNPKREYRIWLRFISNYYYYSFRLWPVYFFKELLSWGTEKGSLLNLSDGGHFDNLGIYALLQRRCRYIIASDAGMDPNYELKDLSGLIRKARVDLGVDFRWLNRGGLSQHPEKKITPLYHMMGEIVYPDEDTPPGILIYVKTTLTGNEPQDLNDYKRRTGSFPDESTGDQFFGEPQFESYRKLGELSGKELLSSAKEEREKHFEKGRLKDSASAEDFFRAVDSCYKRRFPQAGKAEAEAEEAKKAKEELEGYKSQ